MAVLLYSAIYASGTESNILITGVISDGSHPVENAVVTLVSDSQLADTTDANGEFLLSNATGIISRTDWNSGINRIIRLHGSKLHFSVPNKIVTGDVHLLNVNGSCVLSYPPPKKMSGSLTINLPKLANGLYLVTFSTGHMSHSRKLVVSRTGMYLCGSGTSTVSSAVIHQVGRKQAAVDQLKITKEGFATKQVDLTSYEIEDLSILFEPDSIANATSLCKRYTNFFPIGAAIDGNSYRDSHAAIWKEHFNSMVCENEMKWDALEPQAGNFQFGTANGMVNAAIQNGMMVRGHCLVWFDQTPDWVFQGSKEQVLQRLRNHVTKVMQEFKGRVYAWDVVNEAVIGYDAAGQDVGEELGSLDHWGYRDSKWYQITGEDHIFEAFRTARKVDPDVKLFYNDFWNYLDEKRDFIISFVKKLQKENLIDGIGLQCHLNISPAQEKMSNQTVHQTVENLEKEIQEYAALGLDVHITELDISIYTRDYSSDDRSKWYNGNDLNEEYQDRLAARYREFFEMFRRNADKIQNVTLWGISDDNTWLSEFDSGRPDHPLLFDKQLQPKKAFNSIMNF